MSVAISRKLAVMLGSLCVVATPILVGCATGGGGGGTAGGSENDNGTVANENAAVDNENGAATNENVAVDNENGAATNENASGDGGGIVQDQPGLMYVLQPGDMSAEELGETGFAWMILEPSRTGDAAGEFTAADIEAIRTGGPCPKTILAYLSVGEAEDYRDYFDPEWVDGDEGPPISGVAPEWLGPTNPDWLGNYKVRYWMAEWQSLMLGTADGPNKTPLDRIIDAGFDGVYLDIIDAYYFWSEAEGGFELSRAEARRRMIEWVQTISAYARETRGVEGFMVFPQNAADIIRDDDDELDGLSDDYFDAIDGIGIEDLYYDETNRQPAGDTEYRLEQLVEYRDRGKTVLVTDYLLSTSYTPANSDQRVADFYERALGAGFVPYAATEDRELNVIVTLPSSAGWSVDQPADRCE